MPMRPLRLPPSDRIVADAYAGLLIAPTKGAAPAVYR